MDKQMCAIYAKTISSGIHTYSVVLSSGIWLRDCLCSHHQHMQNMYECFCVCLCVYCLLAVYCVLVVHIDTPTFVYVPNGYGNFFYINWISTRWAIPDFFLCVCVCMFI